MVTKHKLAGKVQIYPKTPKLQARLQIAYNFHALV